MIKLPPEIQLMDKEEQEDYIRRMKALEVKKKNIVVKRPIRPPEWKTMSKIEQRDYNRFMKEKEERGLKMTWAEHLSHVARRARFWDKENIRLEENAARIASKVKKQLEEAAAKPKKVFSTPEIRAKAKAKAEVEVKASIEPVVNIIKEKIRDIIPQVKEKVRVVIQPVVKEKKATALLSDTVQSTAGVARFQGYAKHRISRRLVVVAMLGIGAAALYFMRRKK